MDKSLPLPQNFVPPITWV